MLQNPPRQMEPVWQTRQVEPLMPHAAAVGMETHIPLGSQQPEQLLGRHLGFAGPHAVSPNENAARARRWSCFMADSRN
jgi:hypothetical protein